MNRIRISSSIVNFKENLLKRYSDYGLWGIRTLYEPTLFFGMYHELDYGRFLLHQGKKTIFWCGSDILQITNVSILKEARHVVENDVEQAELAKYGLESEVHPMIFDDPDKYPVSYKHSKKPQVFFTVHPGRYVEYGFNEVVQLAKRLPNITFHAYGTSGKKRMGNLYLHGQVPNDVFNEEIKEYQASIRLNRFDGFAETTAKSILMGQYPISKIKYLEISAPQTTKEMIYPLNNLVHKRIPNPKRDMWYNVLSKRVEI